MSTEQQAFDEFEDEAKHNDGAVGVKVTYVNTSETEDFRAPSSVTLNDVFNRAYELLKETRRDTDKYFCKEGGLDLKPYLNETLRELHRRKICHKRHYEIAGESGGA